MRMKTYSMRLPVDLIDRLDEKARDRGKTRSELIRDGLEMYWRHPQGSDANADAFMEMQGHWMQEKARTDRLKELAKAVLRQLNDVMNWYHEPLRDGGGDTGSYLFHRIQEQAADIENALHKEEEEGNDDEQ